MTYCTPDEVRSTGTGLSVNAPVPLTDELLDSVIERASRFFDGLCGVKAGYFEPVETGAVATLKTIYANGGLLLPLPPYVPGSLVSPLGVPTGYTAQTFVEREGYLALADENGILHSDGCFGVGWYTGVPLAITAIWGYEATPADVKMAVIELVINIFRETDPAALRLTNPDGSYLRENAPPRVKEIARRYRLTETKAVFV